VNSGVLALDNQAGAWSSTANVTIASGGLLAMRGQNITVANLSGAGDVFNSSTINGAAGDTLTINNSAANTFSGIIHGNVATGGTDGAIEQGIINLVKTGAATQTLSGANTYAGTTAVNAGTLKGGSSSSFGSAAGLSLGAGSFIDLAGVNLTIGSLAGAGTVTNSGVAATLTVGSDNTSTTFSGVIQDGAGATALQKGGTGTMTLTGSNTYTGATRVNGGTLVIGATGSLGGGTYAGALNFFGGHFTYSGSAAQTLSGAITLSAAATLTNTSTSMLTMSNSVSLGANTLTLLGNGTGVGGGTQNITISGTMSGTAITALTIGNTTTGSNVIISGNNTFTGAIWFPAGNSQPNSVLTISNSGALGTGTKTVTMTGGGELHLKNNITLGSNISFATSGNALQNSVSTGAYVITNDSGNNTINGTISLFAGNGNTRIVSTTGTLTLNGNLAATVAGRTLALDGPGSIIVNGSISDGTNPLALQFGGNSSGGTFTLGGTNTYTSTTAISSGTLKAGSVSAFSSASAFTINSGSVLDLAGFSNTIGSLAGAGSVTNSGVAATLTAGGDNTATTFSGVIQDGTGATALTKAGTGTMTLSGANTYSGTTTVNAGTLALTGSWTRTGATANVATASGATLSGTGVVTASTLALSGTGTVNLSGANSIATLTASGTVGAITLNNTKQLSVSSITTGGQAIAITSSSATSEAITLNGTTLNTNGGAVSLVTSSGPIGLRTSSINTGGGNVTITGVSNDVTAGSVLFNSTTTTSPYYGVWMNSFSLNTGAGTGTITGTGGSNGSGALVLKSANSFTSTSPGGISMTGTSTYGVVTEYQSNFTSAGNTTLSGIVSAQVGIREGIRIGDSSTYTATSGTLTLSGTSGVSTGTNGINFVGTASLIANAGANIVVNGQATGASPGAGISVVGALSTTGNVSLLGNSVNSSGIVLSAPLTMNSGALTLQGVSSSTSGFSSTSNVVMTAGTMTVDLSGTGSISGVISGAGNLAKTGTGTLTLSGANTYTGATTVNAGTLTLSGSLNIGAGTANTSVASGATLNGTGVITADTLTQSGLGTLALTGNNMVNTLSSSGTVGSLAFKNAKSLAVGSIQGTNMTIQAAGATSDLTLNAGTVLSASGTGTPVVLAAGRNFINNSNSGAILLSGASSPSWQIYSTSPGANTFNGLDSGNSAVWNTTYGQSVSQTGKRYIFSTSPTVTFTSVNDTKTYGNDGTAAVAADYTVTGASSGVSGAFLGDSNAAAFSGTPSVTSSGSGVLANVGSYGITIAAGTLSSLNGYTLAFSSAGTLTVGTRAITVTADAKSMTYGGSVPALTQSVTSGSLVNGDTLSGALATSASSTSNIGTYAITQGTLAASSNYALTYVGNNVTIGTRSITVTADPKSMTYGNSTPSLTYAVGGLGLVNGDALTGALATTASSTTNIGTYGITQGTVAASSNYAVTYVGNNVTVGTRAITVTADPKSMTYGNSTPSLTYAVGGLGLVNSDTLSGALATTANSTSNIGTYGITQGTVAASSNYAVTYVGNNVTVGTRAITVTADPKSMTYGNSTPSLTYAVGGLGLVNSDTLSGALATTAASTSNIGAYGITQGTLAASANYALTYVGDNVTIGTRAITVTAAAKSMAYGDAVPTLTQSVTSGSLVNGDTLSGALVTTASSTSNIGTYGITQGTLAALSNYALTYVGDNVTIGTRAITVTADAKSMAYGDAVPALTYVVSGAGLVNGNTLSGALATTATSTANIGTYSITQGTLAASSNYAVTYVGNSVTIGTRAITVNADAKAMSYGDSVPALTYTIGGSGLANGDSLAGALATTAAPTANVGTYAITQGTLAASSNYALTYVGNNVTIAKRALALTATADAKTMAYGDTVPTLTYTIGGSGLVNGDTLSGALATTATSTSNVGTYPITQGTLAASSNYNFSFTGNSLTIGQRAVTVTADAQNMTYGNAVPGLTYVIGGSGLANGDTLSGVLTTSASSTSSVGTYAIGQGTLAASSNYALTYVGDFVTIGTRAITVTADAQNMTYGNALPTLSYVISGLGLTNGDTLSGALTTSASSTSNVGTYVIGQGTLAASSNYALSYVGNNVTIGTRALSVTANAQNMAYGDPVPALTYVIGGLGLVNSDALSGALSSVASSTSSVGTYGITQGTLAASSNYALTYTAADVTVGQRALTVTAAAKSMAYGDSVPALTYSTGGAGLVNGDTLSGALATVASSTSNVGTYGITQGTLAASPNYAVTYVGNNVIIGTRALTVTAAAKSMAYGDSVPTLTYSTGVPAWSTVTRSPAPLLPQPLLHPTSAAMLLLRVRSLPRPTTQSPMPATT